MSSLNWTPDMEASLFYAMIDHKPVGENKHFHMIFIYDKYNNLNEKKINADQIWEHLNTLYDLNALVSRGNYMKSFVLMFMTNETGFFIQLIFIDKKNFNGTVLNDQVKFKNLKFHKFINTEFPEKLGVRKRQSLPYYPRGIKASQLDYNNSIPSEWNLLY